MAGADGHNFIARAENLEMTVPVSLASWPQPRALIPKPSYPSALWSTIHIICRLRVPITEGDEAEKRFALSNIGEQRDGKSFPQHFRPGIRI
jgi:hypothetical protein